MAIIIGSDEAGKRLKEVIKSYLLDNKYDVVDVTEGQEVDFVDATLAVAKDVQSQEGNLGIVIDAFGAGSFGLWLTISSPSHSFGVVCCGEVDSFFNKSIN